jgi:hypothetical protein
MISDAMNEHKMEPTIGLEPMTCRLRNNHRRPGAAVTRVNSGVVRGQSGSFGRTWQQNTGQITGQLFASNSIRFPQSASNAAANVVRQVSMLALAETTLAFLAVPHGLPATTENFRANPAVCPFSRLNQFPCSAFPHGCCRYRSHALLPPNRNSPSV